jgi:hypothetical protein
MRGSRNLFLFLLTILLPPSAPAQQQRSSSGMLRAMTIDHPERMSGSWEVKGEDAIYGLHIQLTAKVDGAPATLTGVRQISHDAEVYRRMGPTRKTGGGNWLSFDSPEVQWNAKHLALEHAATHPHGRFMFLACAVNGARVDVADHVHNELWTSPSRSHPSRAARTGLSAPSPNQSLRRKSEWRKIYVGTSMGSMIRWRMLQKSK